MLCRVMRLLSVLLILSACADPGGYQVHTQDPPVTNKRLQLFIFSADWCVHCKEEMPLVHDLLGSAVYPKHLKATVFVVEGQRFKRPTAEIIARFKEDMEVQGVTFDFEEDPWRWLGYKKYFGAPGDLPASVLLDEEGTNVLATFRGVSPEEMVATIKKELAK